jgi:nucleotide-binding universal stress UspA family protein
LIVEAIERAGYAPGTQIALALDPAASSFWQDGAYNLRKSGAGRLSSDDLQSLYERWVSRYPVVSIEDGFAENDWEAFKKQSTKFGDTIQVVGDDLYVTNRKLIERGIAEKATNAVLIKLNQIGTVTETIDAIAACKTAGWNYIVSHRSGETDDPFIADFAVAMGGGQIKAGAPCRGERIAKYNRLLEIERECGANAEYRTPFVYPQGAAPSLPDTRTHSTPSGSEVVAIIEEAASTQRCLDVARQAVAASKTLSLTALHICADPEKLVGAAEEIDLQMLRERREGTAQERMDHVHHAFDEWATASAMSVRWVQLVGDITSSLAQAVKSAALIAICKPHNMDSADALHAALFDSRRPVLFIPTDEPAQPHFGQHLLIAWKPRPHARSAVQHTLLWIRAAERVSVAIVNEADDSHDADEVQRILNENGIKPNIRHVHAAPGEHIADRLLKEADAIGADALVMGAYRFGEVIEWALGGVTREIMNRTHLPVFMMH